ncbi:RcnB family protein [Pigmentiphaga sp.]|uniref:RcnB family protein n=1 Tax=Pigmentiphaga sp. TaxID=1977564 RepID=UPI0025F841A2|nr:RcnB family protein [Pigmentiphaga sp.]
MSHHGGPGKHKPPGHRPHAVPPGHVHVHVHTDPHYRPWAKGQRVPLPYRGPQYVVVDWRGHHLPPPPKHYHWINVGADYFLVGVATGIVLQSILGR